MSSQFRVYKQNAFFGVAFGIALVLIGTTMVTTRPLFAPLLVFSGVWVAGGNFNRLARIWAIERQLHGQAARDRFFSDFSRASLPRQVFWLLFAVAEVDGMPEVEERELVRRFLLERFTDPITAAELHSWEANRIPPEQVGALAIHLRRILSRPERETLFYWCCLVAFADRHFHPDEHNALQDIARGLGFPAYHARRIFMHAKARVLGQDTRWSDASGGSFQGAAPQAARQRALAMLGLEEHATPEQIRHRHRELAKQFHPDKHSHLGPVAAEEATRRFREIQSAYELLSAG